MPGHTYPIMKTKVLTSMQNRAFAERSTIAMMQKDTARPASLKQRKGSQHTIASRPKMATDASRHALYLLSQNGYGRKVFRSATMNKLATVSKGDLYVESK